ncbi:hypothetical protein AB0L40_12215 [Patulibacter sp. NPDC049589]|uniref:hypothetical protein n=1 Tax=Patulibacter sp. NPDC049589 TaxID=3154731 RepID=UPI0034315B32
MTQDITEALARATTLAASWTVDSVHAATRRLAAASDSRLTIDWDDDAGEDWARLLDGPTVVALISAQIPLLIVSDSLPKPALSTTDEFVVLTVGEMDTAALSANVEVLRSAFPQIWALSLADGGGLSPDRFSPDELWFLTV